jgi:hypothetical protein
MGSQDPELLRPERSDQLDTTGATGVGSFRLQDA